MNKVILALLALTFYLGLGSCCSRQNHTDCNAHDCACIENCGCSSDCVCHQSD